MSLKIKKFLNQIKYNPFKYWAIVTGASQGLGLAYAKSLLNIGVCVVIVSRNSDNAFNELKKIYSKEYIKNINLDLSETSNCIKLFEFVKDLNIAILVNNAGFGVWGEFWETNIEDEIKMINLNIIALQFLSKLLIKKFMKNNFGRIINISSIGAFTPGPFFSSYYASKSFVNSFSQAINTELIKSKSNVRVMSVCPGTLKTNFWNSSIKNSDRVFKVDNDNTQKYADKTLKIALKKNKGFIISTNAHRIGKMFIDVCSTNFMNNVIYKYQKNKSK